MEQPIVLRETKMGQKGFVREDVLMYLDELNTKITDLTKELEESSGKKPADSQEIIKYRNQIDNLQEKLNASNNALRMAKKENEELQQQISKLKAGTSAPAATPAVDAQTKAALEAAKKEIDSLRAQLKAANEKASAASAASAANAHSGDDKAALEAAKKELNTLRGQLKSANDKLAEATKANNNKSTEELNKANQQISKITAELEAAKKNTSEMEDKIKELTAKGDDAAKKDEEISKLNSEISSLKDTINNPTALMGSLFADAQKIISQHKADAEQEAAQKIKEADDKAATVIREANEAADKTIKEANAVAEKTIADANMKSKITVDDANTKASKVNEMSSTIRSMLLNEIENINSKFSDISSAIMDLTGQASNKMKDAQLILDEAKKSVSPSEDNNVKLAETPKADFSAVKAPTVDMAKNESKNEFTNDDPFSKVSGGSYNNRNAANSFNKPISNPAPVHEAPKPAPKKPVSNFSFDMSDLLKAAEEEAAKEDI